MSDAVSKRKFAAVYIAEGELRRLVFEANDAEEAKLLATKWGVGIEGETPSLGHESAPLPLAYNEKTARALLGGISRTTLYAELATGRLKRLPGVRRVLVTRQSIEQRHLHN